MKSCALAGGYLPIDKAEGPQAQYSYYQQTYQQAQQSLDSNSGLKGIMFWRWAGVDPTAQLASTDFNEAATIGARFPSIPCALQRVRSQVDWIHLSLIS